MKPRVVVFVFLAALVQMVSAQQPGRPARFAVEGQLEAENYSGTSKAVTIIETPRYEPGGGQCVQVPGSGTRMSYPVTVSEAGLYDIKIRYSLSTDVLPTVRIKVNGGSTVIAELLLAKTPSTVYLDTAILRNVSLGAGDQTLDFVFDGASSGFGNHFLVNWIYLELRPRNVGTIYNIFVSPNGNDSASGTSSTTPYKTVQKAFDQVASIIASNPQHGPIKIKMMSGYHELAKTLVLGAGHAGTAAGPVYLSPETATTTAIIGGGRKINASSLQLVSDTATLNRLHPTGRGKVYKVTLNDADWQARFAELIVSVNGDLQTLAQFPNRPLLETKDLIPASGSCKLVLPFTVAPWQAEIAAGNAVIATGHIDSGPEFGRGRQVASVANDGRITLVGVTSFGTGYTPRLRVANLLCELDRAGEWYYDKKAGVFYLWPAVALSSNPDIRVAGNFDLISAKSQKFFIISNMKFQDAGNVNTGVGLSGANCEVRGCEFRAMDAHGTLSIGGISMRCSSSDFHHVRTGPTVNGPSIRTLPLRFGNCEAVNNFVYKTTMYGYTGMISVTGVGTRMANNVFTEVQGGATYNELAGCLIENNEVFSSGYQNGDWTPFYSDASYLCADNVFRNNFLHNLIRLGGTRRSGVFRAEMPGFSYCGNVFYKTFDYGMAAGKVGQTANNNVMVDSNYLLLSGTPRVGGTGGRIYEPADTAAEVADALAWDRNGATGKAVRVSPAEAIWGQNYWTTAYFKWQFPVLARGMNLSPFAMHEFEFKRNYLANCKSAMSFGFTGEWAGKTFAQIGVKIDSPITISTSVFQNMNTLDLRFNSTITPVSGFWPIPLERVGLYVDAHYRPSVSDRAAYRSAAKSRWSAYTSIPENGGYKPAYASDVYPPMSNINTKPPGF